MRLLRILALCLLMHGLAQAQAPTPQAVVITAHDGLALHGDWYWQSSDAPTVLLLHQLYSDRTGWRGLDSAFLNAGYNVLAVDLRGYGATGGRIAWRNAVRDVQAWADWARAEGNINGDRLFMVGSSMGSVLAMVGCGNDSACAGVVAISPGWEYYGIGVRRALEGGLADKPSLIVYAERDRYPALGVPRMLKIAPAGLQVLAFKGNAHGLDLLSQEAETLFPQLVAFMQ
jgi:pimeloyl-ACP methyl ester carboxylesterase